MRFLAHPRASTFQITVLVRDAKKAEKLMELGVDAVVGSHKDAPLVEKLASEADVVIAMVCAFNIFLGLQLKVCT
jgi:D-arabinose 1-dehydrogenase-like Zn-dependent alcohol dehydrogenase